MIEKTTDKRIYRKVYCASLIPRAHVLQLRREMGIPEDEIDYKSSLDIQDEIYSAMSTLTAVFDKDHPDNDLYCRIKIKLNHYELWSKIENDLHELIRDFDDHNKQDSYCPTCGEN